MRLGCGCVSVFLVVLKMLYLLTKLTNYFLPMLPNPPISCINLLLLRFASGVRFDAARLVL